MVTLQLLNARRTGDDQYHHSRIQVFEGHEHLSRRHIVFVFEHKTASSFRCPVNFHGDLYRRASQYVEGRRFLYSSQFMFPYVSANSSDTSVKMTHSQFNVAIKRLWSAYRSQAMDDELPEKINSRYIRHSFVTAVHERGENPNDGGC
jgi:hypothetical protein